ncbi:hypothetical protein Cgig2_013665 [Carnegiea gigantea]|uniref:Uncharacterized protein n=1 Tax=Carnegiea gigantea TaxID=171969 RepID=A0A9Q1GUZ7_9CARY|nr:hypothetical protein Cgig2_013665 [Carnegiea gigantea]
MKGIITVTIYGHNLVCKPKVTIMDKHKQEIEKWENGMVERIEQKFSDSYKKMGCVAAMDDPTSHLQPTCPPYETCDMGKVDDRTRFVVSRKELDEEYNQCILPPNNGRQPSRPPLKHRESQTQGKKAHRCLKCSKVRQMRQTSYNLWSDLPTTCVIFALISNELSTVIHSRFQILNGQCVQTCTILCISDE